MSDLIKNYSISIYLDTRRAKKNGLYPVKLRVFTNKPRKQKLYPTSYDFSKSDFEKMMVDNSKSFKDDRQTLEAIDKGAEEIAKTIKPFRFDVFEKAMFGDKNNRSKNVNALYNIAIENYKLNDQLGTASSYELSLKSLLAYHSKDSIDFYNVDENWLKGYERKMLKDDKSRTTIGIYLRPLRAIFNKAIKEGIIDEVYYPFGKGKYTIPAPQGIKKALSKEQLKVLFGGKPNTPEQEKAKAYWFFSYACNGINFKDMLNLKQRDINKDTLSFVRAKTSNTKKDSKPIQVHLNDFILSVIEEQGNKDKSPQNLIFPILNNIDNSEDKKRKTQNFIRFVNQHFKKYAESLGINENISTYWARHSYATIAITNGASMEFVSEALNHSSLETTKRYFKGFEDEKKKEISNTLIDVIS